jgi:hypothetical protein
MTRGYSPFEKREDLRGVSLGTAADGGQGATPDVQETGRLRVPHNNDAAYMPLADLE